MRTGRIRAQADEMQFANIHFPRARRAMRFALAVALMIPTLSPQDAIENVQKCVEFFGFGVPPWFTAATLGEPVRYIFGVAATALTIWGFWPGKKKLDTSQLPRAIAYEPAGVSLANGRIAAFKAGVVNNASTLVSVRLISAEMKVNDIVLGRVISRQPALLGHKQTAFWEIPASGEIPAVANPKTYIPASVEGTLGEPNLTPEAATGFATVEIEYDDVPPQGIRRSRISYSFPTNCGGYSTTVLSQEEF